MPVFDWTRTELEDGSTAFEYTQEAVDALTPKKCLNPSQAILTKQLCPATAFMTECSVLVTFRAFGNQLKKKMRRNNSAEF